MTIVAARAKCSLVRIPSRLRCFNSVHFAMCFFSISLAVWTFCFRVKRSQLTEIAFQTLVSFVAPKHWIQKNMLNCYAIEQVYFTFCAPFFPQRRARYRLRLSLGTSRADVLARLCKVRVR